MQMFLHLLHPVKVKQIISARAVKSDLFFNFYTELMCY